MDKAEIVCTGNPRTRTAASGFIVEIISDVKRVSRRSRLMKEVEQDTSPRLSAAPEHSVALTRRHKPTLLTSAWRCQRRLTATKTYYNPCLHGYMSYVCFCPAKLAVCAKLSRLTRCSGVITFARPFTSTQRKSKRPFDAMTDQLILKSY